MDPHQDNENFDEQVVQLIADCQFLHGIAPDLAAAAESADPWIFALKECVERLTQRDRELLKGRYDDGSSIQALAADAGRSADTIYKLLRRIHEDLFDCITAKFKEDDRP